MYPPEANFAEGFALGAIMAGILAMVFTSWLYSRRDRRYRYVPVNAEVVYDRDLVKIGKGIAAEIYHAKAQGIKLGREQIITAMEAEVENRKSKREEVRPWILLDIKPGQEHLAGSKAILLKGEYELIKECTKDGEIIELCDLRIKTIDDAVRIVTRHKQFTRGGDI